MIVRRQYNRKSTFPPVKARPGAEERGPEETVAGTRREFYNTDNRRVGRVKRPLNHQSATHRTEIGGRASVVVWV